jgi:hypothetical protein
MPDGDIAARSLTKSRILKLYIGKTFTGVTVEPDSQWPKMWRVCKDGRKSDMVNLARAKDAAIVWARPRGLGGTEIPYWRHRETASGQG